VVPVSTPEYGITAEYCVFFAQKGVPRTQSKKILSYLPCRSVHPTAFFTLETTLLFSIQFITLFNTQNAMETRLSKLHYFEAPEFENDIEMFSLALVFELQLWPEISIFLTIY
jgi:hypothetical protein